MAKLVQKRCPQCNAPLSVGSADTMVTCRYCGAVHTISHDKQPKPPKVQAFGSANVVQIPTNVVYMGGSQAAGGAVWVIFVGIIVLLSVIGGFIGKTGRIFVKLPLVCKTNESITLKGKKFDGPGPAIEANTNCKITIENSVISSTESVISGPNASNVELRLVNTSLTSSKGHAIDLGTNGKVWLTKGSKLKGAEDGIHGTINIEVDVKDSSIEGGLVGVNTNSNAKVSLTNAQVSGKEHAFKFGSSAKVTAKATTIKSDETCFESSGSAVLELQETNLTCGDDGIRFTSSSGDVKLTKKSTIVTKKGAGIRAASSNMKVLLDESRVESDGSGIDGNGNADVRLKNNSTVRGNSVGIDSSYNLKLALDGGKIESQKVAVRGASGAEIRVADGTTIKAPKAFEFSSKPSRFEVPASVVPLEQQDFTPTGGSGGSGPSGGNSSAIMAAVVKSCVSGQKGRIVLQTTVSPAGNVIAVKVAASTLPPATSNCIASRIRSIRFPSQPSVTTTTQTYTIN